MSDLSHLSDSELREELERRENARIKASAPEQIANPDWGRVRKICSDVVQEICDGRYSTF